MKDLFSLMESICRPRLLIQAARIGVDDYNRKTSLRRLLRSAPPLGTGKTIAHLMNLEQVMEDKRLTGDASYSITRHVEVLSAMMAEANILRERRSQM